MPTISHAQAFHSSGYYEGEGGTHAPIEQKPIVRHPRLDEEVLYIGLDDPDDLARNYQSFVVGYSTPESYRLMQDVNNTLRTPSVLYAHAWQEGDVLICDNFLVCHGRNPFQDGERRKLLRVAVS